MFSVKKVLCFSVLSMLSCSGFASSNQRNQHIALEWYNHQSNRTNIVPFVWLRATSSPKDIVRQMQKLPKDLKVMFSYDFHNKLYDWQKKRYKQIWGKQIENKDAYGINNHPDDGVLWWDNGVKSVQKRLNQFLAEYKNKGGTLDYFILDFESGMSNWHLRNKSETFKEIEEDPRFPEIINETGIKDLSKLWNYKKRRQYPSAYLKWNGTMYGRVIDYLNQATYDVVKKYYPEVKMSNYQSVYASEKFPVPDINGCKSYMFRKGGHVGTHQSPQLYCKLNNITQKKLDGKTKYTATPFNGFKYAVNSVRACKLVSAIPIMPWISHKKYKESQIKNSDLYQELIFHSALTGVNTFLLWNPKAWNKKLNPKEWGDEKQDILVSDCLFQLDEILGREKNEPLIKKLVKWDADFVLTGMNVKSHSIWRFTPNLHDEQKIYDFVIQKSPVILKIGNKKIKIADSSIITPEKQLSNAGIWIKAPVNAKIIYSE